MKKTHVIRNVAIVLAGLVFSAVVAAAEDKAPEESASLQPARDAVKEVNNSKLRLLKAKAAIAKAKAEIYAALDNKDTTDQQKAKLNNELTNIAGLEAELAETEKSQGFFDPKNWAIGVALMKNRPGIVSDAAVDSSGVVRANTVENTSARLLIVRQYYPNYDKLYCVKSFCPGLFVSVGIGGGSGTQAIDMLGYGILLGSKESEADSDSNRKHNLGIGWGRRFGVKLLDERYVPGQPAPSGSQTVHYQTRDINVRPFLMYSYKF